MTDLDRAYDEHNRGHVAELARQSDERDQRARMARADFERRKAAAADALGVAEDAAGRAYRATTIASDHMQEFRLANAVRRDVALRQLDGALANARAQLDEELLGMRRVLCDPVRVVSPDWLVKVAGLVAASEPVFADRLRELVDAGEFSPLDSAGVAERITAARVHKRAVDAALGAARAQVGSIAQVIKELDNGEDAADPVPLAEAAVEANSRAQAALGAVIAALKGEPTTQGTD